MLNGVISVHKSFVRTKFRQQILSSAVLPAGYYYNKWYIDTNTTADFCIVISIGNPVVGDKLNIHLSHADT